MPLVKSNGSNTYKLAHPRMYRQGCYERWKSSLSTLRLNRNGVCGTDDQRELFDEDIAALRWSIQCGRTIMPITTDWRDTHWEQDLGRDVWELPPPPPIPRRVLADRIRKGLEIYYAQRKPSAEVVRHAVHSLPIHIHTERQLDSVQEGYRRVTCPVCQKTKDIPLDERAFCYHPASQINAISQK